ncbi:MAG: glycosyltransferase [bacterium]
MNIALLGSRGIPAHYSGFETFYEQLAIRLVQRGHQVTVYNRSRHISGVRGSYMGVRLITLPAIPTKHLETISHTFFSSLHAIFQRYDIAYYCIAGNSPLVWLSRLGGARTLLNVDGQDWAREKWGGFARWYQRRCERIAGTTAGVLIADAKVIQQRYRAEYNIKTVFAPYGAEIRNDSRTDALQHWGLSPRKYLLFVSRLVPENAADLLLRAFRQVRTQMKLVIAGDATYSKQYKADLHTLADDRVVFTGYAFGETYAQLSSHTYLFVLPSGVDGTRPVLLDQMGFGNAVLVRNSPANMEVIGDKGFSFDRSRATESLTETLQALIDAPERVDAMRMQAIARITNYYNWDRIADFYENLFRRMLEKQEPLNYDQFDPANH